MSHARPSRLATMAAALGALLAFDRDASAKLANMHGRAQPGQLLMFAVALLLIGLVIYDVGMFTTLLTSVAR